jgi:hypothetical protein
MLQLPKAVNEQLPVAACAEPAARIGAINKNVEKFLKTRSFVIWD